jgi:hypothetical protein
VIAQQAQGPEFKPQHCQKDKNRNQTKKQQKGI